MSAGSASLRALADLAVSTITVEQMWAEALCPVCLDLNADAGIAMGVVGSERMHVAATSCWPTPLDQLFIPIAPDSQAAFVLATDRTVLPRRRGHRARRVHRSTLLSISRHIESLASHIDSIVLSSVQHVDRYSTATQGQYAALEERSRCWPSTRIPRRTSGTTT